MVLHLTSCVCLGPVVPAFIPPVIAMNEGERYSRVLAIIRECGGISRHSLTKKTQYLNHAMREVVITDLLDRGRITAKVIKTDTQGRPGTWYYAA